MKLSLVSDSLSDLSLHGLLETATQCGLQGIEFTTGNWSTAPHFDLEKLLESAAARDALVASLSDRGLEISALNCNGNQLHPISGDAHDRVVKDTIRLSGLLGLDTVVLMSGLPAAHPDDKVPNWITSSWPPENQSMLAWQWTEKLLPYWRGLVRFAEDHGVKCLAVEMHGAQLVYSPATLMQLRQEIGDTVCANLDPSHLMWMGADAIAAADYLGSAIAHVHGKDTFINKPQAAIRSLMENGPLDSAAGRSWTHATIGVGHDQKWWTDFFYRLALNGYDGWISIEHEDATMSRKEGLRRAVAMLNETALFEAPDYVVQSI
ncbi:sugar phosphate isomerase/epimerase family protein [Hoeflea prorocentri]|uniref:Sugar phosphate isomerase/epimerase n=1 Tax=Hoeflea prorocentri TaxID=1922333 RepID=A0A9X3ZGB4_9HYPH|nr:sugar phosphate isomerase/epimerase [Hoeflea prorocentri]MCY6379738.1 sugar phosphate isomerase/epimerase [Hoeflea prorocentri]MDA5397538.1 sugar phosphate isomerase/epimerase [Hoeflea prorocentri]